MPFKGLWTVRPRLCLGLDTISIGFQTTKESHPSDSSTAVITLSFLTISCSVLLGCDESPSVYRILTLPIHVALHNIPTFVSIACKLQKEFANRGFQLYEIVQILMILYFTCAEECRILLWMTDVNHYFSNTFFSTQAVHVVLYLYTLCTGPPLPGLHLDWLGHQGR